MITFVRIHHVVINIGCNVRLNVIVR